MNGEKRRGNPTAESNLGRIGAGNNIYLRGRTTRGRALRGIATLNDRWAGRPVASVRPEDGNVIRGWRVRVEDEEQAVFAELGGWFPRGDLACLGVGRLRVRLVGIFRGMTPKPACA